MMQGVTNRMTSLFDSSAALKLYKPPSQPATDPNNRISNHHLLSFKLQQLSLALHLLLQWPTTRASVTSLAVTVSTIFLPVLLTLTLHLPEATLNNPKVSDEAKEHSREVIEDLQQSGEYQPQESFKNEGNVVGGHKVRLAI